MSEFGENIWDISSWTTDITWKDNHLHQYFDTLPFTECITEILDIAQTYFESVYSSFDDDEEGIAEPEFPYLDIVVLLTEEYLFGFFFHSTVTSLQELQLLEILCTYFQENKLDAVRYFVFDCLFGLPGENLDLQIGMMEHKMSLMCKLTSMAVGTACDKVLNCVAVWLYNYGVQCSRGGKVAYAVVNDYCCVSPKAIGAIRNLINVSPVFANQFAVALSNYYRENSGDQNTTESKELLPPTLLIEILSSWIIEQPSFCSVMVPTLFRSLPCIHKFERPPNREFELCPILSYIELCCLEPLLHSTEHSAKDTNKCYSKLHYGLLRFVSAEKKNGAAPVMDSDGEIEPGELLEDSDGADLISTADVHYLIKVFKRLSKTYPAATVSQKDESKNRLIQLLQVAKWAGTYDFPSKKLCGMLTDLPKNSLLKLVLSGCA